MIMTETPTVPGEFCCPECGFVVVKSILYAENGAVARDTTDRMELCPNDGTILRPVAYADALDEARHEACRMGARARIGEQMEVLLHNLLVRGRLSGHEKTAAENIVKDWEQRVANERPYRKQEQA